ncbi:MAG: NAD(P)-binding protein [Candidatus Lambdaproteobacteria bacterium]|nr:NAD(P)-binding protein [Candidatus Lambdaproteobacteria bacterium]
MASDREFEAIVVGAGPAGSMAAWRLAALGRRVALLERGPFPGAKNLFGGMVYSVELARHFPGFATEAPIERPVTRHATYLLDAGRHLLLDFACEPFGEAPYNGFTCYRSRFDRWLAERAVAAGALLLPATVADGLLVERGRVTGVAVRREGGALRAPIVIAADGALSLLGQQAGLVAPPDPRHFSLGVREVLALPEQTIEERFQIEPGGGCAALFLGTIPGEMQGGGFIYTQRDTLAVGFVAQLESLQRSTLGAPEALDAFKAHPTVRRLIQGGERLEFGAHLVPEAGGSVARRLAGEGILLAGDAAGLVLAGGILYEGVHYAMHSGVLAAEAAHQALAKGDTGRRGLAPYERALARSYVGRNLQTFRAIPGFLAGPRLYRQYPAALCRAAEAFFRADDAGHRKLGALLRRQLRGIPPLAILKDLWRAARAWVC